MPFPLLIDVSYSSLFDRINHTKVIAPDHKTKREAKKNKWIKGYRIVKQKAGINGYKFCRRKLQTMDCTLDIETGF
jgi:hypothetical protein